LNGSSKKITLPQQYSNYAEWIKDLYAHKKEPHEIRQITGCSKSYVWRYKPKEEGEARPETSDIEVETVTEEVSEIPFEPEGEGKKETPAKVKKPSEIPEDVEIFRNMLQGLYTLLCSKEGVLGKEYGRPKESCIEIADQTYRYVARRVDSEDLEQYDTYILVLSHVAFLAPIAWEFVQKKRAEAKVKEEKEKTEIA